MTTPCECGGEGQCRACKDRRRDERWEQSLGPPMRDRKCDNCGRPRGEHHAPIDACPSPSGDGFSELEAFAPTLEGLMAPPPGLPECCARAVRAACGDWHDGAATVAHHDGEHLALTRRGWDAERDRFQRRCAELLERARKAERDRDLAIHAHGELAQAVAEATHELGTATATTPLGRVLILCDRLRGAEASDSIVQAARQWRDTWAEGVVLSDTEWALADAVDAYREDS